MGIDITDLRRLFRNRFEIYLDSNDAQASTELDGSRLTLYECAALLTGDDEPFPVHYRGDIRKLRGRVRLNKPINKLEYGDVAALLVNVLLRGRDRGGKDRLAVE